jgi:hypothetical protein
MQAAAKGGGVREMIIKVADPEVERRFYSLEAEHERLQQDFAGTKQELAEAKRRLKEWEESRVEASGGGGGRFSLWKRGPRVQPTS